MFLGTKGQQGWRKDGWLNTATGLGNAFIDKTLQAYFAGGAVVTDEERKLLYHRSAMARKIARKPAEEGLRKGITINVPEEHGGTDVSSALQMAVDDLRVVPAFINAHALHRAFGGAVIWVGTNDSAGLDQTPGPYSAVKWLIPMDRRYILPIMESVVEDKTDEHFGEPELFRVTRVTESGGAETVQVLHRDRLIIFPGLDVTQDERFSRQGWGLSIFELVYEEFQRHAQAWQNASTTFQDRSYSVAKFANLLDMLEMDGGMDAVQKRVGAVSLARSVARTMIIGDGEEFTHPQLDFGGMPDMLQMFMFDLAAAVDWPVTVLFGRSPAGMNATGESDLTLWYDHVAELRGQEIKPGLERLVEAIMRGTDGPTKGQVLDEWSVEFPALRQMTPEQEGNLRKMQADADVAYINASVLTPEEVAINRFRPGGWSADTSVDLDVREDIIEEDQRHALERAKNPPDPMAMMQAAAAQGGDDDSAEGEPQDGQEEVEADA